MHYQLSVGGDEFKKFPDLAGKVLLCFDVESGHKRNVDSRHIRELRKEIINELDAANVPQLLGEVRPKKGEHVVWEAIDIADLTAEDAIEVPAKRLVEYMNAIHDIAAPVLERLQHEC